MTKPTQAGIILSSKLTQPGHQSLRAVESGTFTGLDLTNLGMTIRLRNMFHNYATAMPTPPDCMQTLINDCTRALQSGQPAVIYADEVKKIRNWIEAFRRQLSRLHIDRIEQVLNTIALNHMIKAQIHGKPVDDQFMEEELERMGLGKPATTTQFLGAQNRAA